MAMEPASSIIAAFGGIGAVSALTGAHRSRVWRWTKPKASGGTGGRVPQDYHRVLLGAARERGLEISAEDLLPAEQPEPAPSSQGAAA